jgi:tetratricopeptide (TPR) repeat protein
MDHLRVLRVVIASPGDVKPERESIPRVVEEVNRNIAHPRGLHLEVHRWETDSYPGFHLEGPQGLIDPILKIEDCDILMGIFWRRFGTPVTDAKSGTEHEFRLAYEAWKKNRKPQIMVYFSQKPYTPQSRDDTDQWGLVLQFKKEFPREGLWWDYKKRGEFEERTRNHLTNFLSTQFPLDKLTLEPAVLAPRFQVPPPPADFTGRKDELRRLRAAIEKGCVHISGLQGQGGVGKTALALKLAAELAPNFPDAQIYLDLKGTSDKPLSAAEAMSHVLRTFHPKAKLPEDEEELCTLFRFVLQDKRALLLMDNAKDAAQVQSLIPPDGCTLLVTSRFRFHLRGVTPKNLDTLSPADAKKLLLRIAPRIDGEAEAIAALCGRLPHALSLAATYIVESFNIVTPADYRQMLADEKNRLKLLGGDKGVGASITLSYNLLEDEEQKRWRMLAVFPDTFDTAAAAAVWEIEIDGAKETLSRLMQYSMLEWKEPARRYRLHDLMRDFARQRLTRAESDIASRMHARHYGAVLSRVDDFYRKGRDSIVNGLALFDLEWGNIQTGQAWAETHSPEGGNAAKLCSGYPDSGAYILHMRQHPSEQVRWNTAGLTAARQLRDRAAEGRHLCNLGNASYSLGLYRPAIKCHKQHLVIAREVGDRSGEGVSLNGLGIAYYSLGDFPRAIEYYKQALVIARKIPDRRGVGNALGNLGTTYADLGKYDQAIKCHEQRLAIARTMGDRQAEGQALGNLGIAHRSLGKHKRAIGYHEKALAINREIGGRWGEGRDLGNLGYAYAELGNSPLAIEYYKQALAIAREIGDRRSEGNTLGNMSLTLDKLGERKKAIEHAKASLKIREQIEDPNAAKVRKQLEEWRSA